MQNTAERKGILVTAWVVVLTVASYKIALQEVFRYPISENVHSGITLLIVAAGFALTFFWRTIRPLRPFFILFMFLIGVEWLVFTQVDRLPLYRRWLNHPSFNVYMLAEQSLRLMVTLSVIAFLTALKRKPAQFFLARGNPAAPAEPVRWLGINEGEKWDSLGKTFAFFISLGTLAFLVIAGRPPLDIVVRALPFLPAVLLAAALNAFNEEMTYKASFLSVLVGAMGKRQALWLMAAFFGILHFYGVPYGVIGVLLAGFLGWFLGKSMVETGGLFWAWFIHFLQDVLIFTFLAIGSITPGG